RIQSEHHGAQEKGRFQIFQDYRLYVGEITDDTDPPAGLTLEQKRFDETSVGNAKVATIAEVKPQKGSQIAAQPDLMRAMLGLDGKRDGCVDVEAFESIYKPGNLLLLAFWRDVQAARAWCQKHLAGAEKVRLRQARIIRDYGMFDRREAPQFYPEVQPPRRPMAAE